MSNMLAGFKVVAVQNVTVTGPIRFKGSNSTRWNVDLDDVPFGQIWTFTAKGEVHPFHAKTLAGAYEAFPTYTEAATFLRGKM